MERRHPSAASLLTFDRPGTDEVLWALAAGRNEFETDAGGRGESYRRAQADAEVRSPGILRLLELVAGGTQVGDLPSGFTVLDVLGGDGVVARLVHRRSSKACHVLTGDIASEMVHRAIGYGLPAVRQPAHFLFVRDRSLDGVLIAYGFHHLTAGERPAACGEAHRVLRPGGRIVLHDFENGSPVATWFQEVVDRYTETGHQYEHFTRDSLRRLLLEAGFQAVILDSVYDPFVVRGRSETEAIDRLLDYVLDMYGLRAGLERACPGASVRARLRELLDAIFRYADGTEGLPEGSGRLRVYQDERGWIAELPRIAIAATGRKDSD